MCPASQGQGAAPTGLGALAGDVTSRRGPIVRRTTLLGLTLTCATALLGVFATPASAATTLPYCSFSIDTGVVACAATEGGLRSALTVASGASPSRALFSATATTTYVLGRLYDDANRTGAYFEITASGPCDTSSDVDWELSSLPAAWNDRTSSFLGSSSCELRVYENNSFGGLSYGAYASTDYVGDAMNDRTSSVRFY